MGKVRNDDVPPEEPVVLLPKIDTIFSMLGPKTALEQAEKKQSEALSAVGKIYQQIEKDHHGNRAAVSFFRRLQKMSHDKRMDFMRTFEPLCAKAGYFLDDAENDLVDAAGNTVDADDDGDTESPPGQAQKSTLPGLDAARAHLTGDKPKLGIVSDESRPH